MSGFRDTQFNTRRPNLVLIWLTLLALVLFGLDTQGLLAPVRSHTAPILAPVTRVMNSSRLGIANWWGNLWSGSALEQENRALKEELTRLQNENVALRSAEVENQSLRRTAGLKDRYGWTSVTANVVGRSPDSEVRMLMIDRGSADGLAVGMPVISHVEGSPDALIGLIDQVQQQSASVLLITDVRSVISTYILHRDQSGQILSQPSGELLGRWQLGSRLVLRKIEREAVFAVGDDVLTAGISRQIGFDMPVARVPANIPIGKISNFHPEGNMQVADIQPYFDPEQVQLVWIIVGID